MVEEHACGGNSILILLLEMAFEKIKFNFPHISQEWNLKIQQMMALFCLYCPNGVFVPNYPY